MSLWDVTDDPFEICERLTYSPENEEMAILQQREELQNKAVVWIVYYNKKV